LQTQEETTTVTVPKTQYLHGPRPRQRWYRGFESRFRIDFHARFYIHHQCSQSHVHSEDRWEWASSYT